MMHEQQLPPTAAQDSEPFKTKCRAALGVVGEFLRFTRTSLEELTQTFDVDLAYHCLRRSEKFACVQPDLSHLWAFRRRVIFLLVANASGDRSTGSTDSSELTRSNTHSNSHSNTHSNTRSNTRSNPHSAAALDLLAKERSLIVSCCRSVHRKSYSLWQWRLLVTAWLVELHNGKELRESLEECEIWKCDDDSSTNAGLCGAAPRGGAPAAPPSTASIALGVEEWDSIEEILDLDGRNFHAWNYRRRLLAILRTSPGLVAAIARIVLKNEKELMAELTPIFPGMIRRDLGDDTSLRQLPQPCGEICDDVTHDKLGAILLMNFATQKALEKNVSNHTAWFERLKLPESIARTEEMLSRLRTALSGTTAAATEDERAAAAAENLAERLADFLEKHLSDEQ